MTSVRSRVLGVVLGVAVASSPGCAIFMRGPNQSVMINWNVPTAKVMLDAKPLEHPGNLQLSRGDDHILIVDAPGYKRKLVTIKSEVSFLWAFPEVALASLLLVSILGLPLAIPLLVDGTSGSVCDLNPDDVDVKLEQEEAPKPVAPPREAWPPASPTPIAAPAPKKICKVCGAVRGDSNFCPECGAK
jgi:hypothetical protein